MEYDEILSVIRGQVLAKPVISIWRHYPKFDLDASRMIEIHTKDLKRFPSDLIKLSPHAKFMEKDFGCILRKGSSNNGAEGASKCVKCIVGNEDNWDRIQEIDVLDGHLGEQLHYISEMKKNFPDKPMMMTIFSPLYVARKLSNNNFFDHFKVNAPNLMDAFKIIEKTVIEFGRASIDMGADGIFSAVQETDRKLLPDIKLKEEMLRLNKPFMHQMNMIAEFTVLHLHGEEPEFQRALDYYKPTAVNWHDRTSTTTLLEARKVFRGGLLGGLDPKQVLSGKLDLEEIKKYYKDIPHILAPGCVLLQGTSDVTLEKIFNMYK